MLHHHHDAEDATQEALVRVVTNLATFRGESRFSTWSWTIATRCVLDFRNGRARRSGVTAEAFAADLADGMASTATPDPETSALLGQVKLGCGRRDAPNPRRRPSGGVRLGRNHGGRSTPSRRGVGDL